MNIKKLMGPLLMAVLFVSILIPSRAQSPPPDSPPLPSAAVAQTTNADDVIAALQAMPEELKKANVRDWKINGVLLIFGVMVLGRLANGLKDNGGLKGVWNSIVMGKKTLGVILMMVGLSVLMLTSGCGTFLSSRSSQLALVKDAAWQGSRIALQQKPADARVALTRASNSLHVLLATGTNIDIVDLMAIVQPLLDGINELKSPEAQIAIQGGTIVLNDLVNAKIFSADQVATIKEFAQALVSGIDLALAENQAALRLKQELTERTEGRPTAVGDACVTLALVRALAYSP